MFDYLLGLWSKGDIFLFLGKTSSCVASAFAVEGTDGGIFSARSLLAFLETELNCLDLSVKKYC